MIITLIDRVGQYAENKDTARDIRQNDIIPAIDSGEEVVHDFEGVDTATQSFIHALISEVISKYGNAALDRIVFKSCNDSIKQFVNIVTGYMQDAIGEG